MERSLLTTLTACAVALGLSSCGGSASPTSPPPPGGVTGTVAELGGLRITARNVESPDTCTLTLSAQNTTNERRTARVFVLAIGSNGGELARLERVIPVPALSTVVADNIWVGQQFRTCSTIASIRFDLTSTSAWLSAGQEGLNGVVRGIRVTQFFTSPGGPDGDLCELIASVRNETSIAKDVRLAYVAFDRDWRLRATATLTTSRNRPVSGSAAGGLSGILFDLAGVPIDNSCDETPGRPLTLELDISNSVVLP